MDYVASPAVQRQDDREQLPTWSMPAATVAARLHVDVETGLSDDEAAERRERYGPNDLRRRKTRSALSILIDQFRSLIVVLLVVAGVVAFLFGEFLEAWAIAVVIGINATLGFVTELRAVRSMEALYALSRVTARVRRSGQVREMDARELVPGDVVVVEGGDTIAADMRLVTGSRLQADESTLTGESMPIAKSAEPVVEDAALADRTSMLYKGTSISRGSGVGVVTETGTGTELGQISELVADADDERTPLEERLDSLGRKLIWVTLGIAVLVTVSGWARGRDLFLMIETGIALAVASIPEGLPIVATIALARGVRIMARRNALINRLSSVETLGAAGVICTDKTGTLTENRMTLVRIATAEVDASVDDDAFDGTDLSIRAALEVGILCNNATRQDAEVSTGDPLEVALLAASVHADIDREEITERCRRVDEEAFDVDVKMMATIHQCTDQYRYAVKGAPEAVIDACTQQRLGDRDDELDEETRNEWRHRNEALASEGLRVLALAEKYAAGEDDEPYEDLVLLALVGLADPPRSDVRPALDKCRDAGIRVVMVTGDQPVTALSVARSVGLVENHEDDIVHGAEMPSVDDMSDEQRARLLRSSVFARVSPAQKLDLIDLYQRAGHIVAMTGDGVNDAPALQKADIGIAMGRRGTQVAREAADMVLRDDAFSSIVAAIEQGRVIFGNIRRFVFYLLSCNVSEVLVVTAATLLGSPLPILPLQILFLNLVTDVFPAMALGMGAGDPSVMKRDPRDPADSVLKRRHWTAIGFYGLIITMSVLGALFTAIEVLHLQGTEAVTISFLTLAFAQLAHVYNMRSISSSPWRNEVVANPYVWGAVALCTGLLLGAVYLPVVADVLKIHAPSIDGWLTVAAFSLIPLVMGQIALAVARRRGASR